VSRRTAGEASPKTINKHWKLRRPRSASSCHHYTARSATRFTFDSNLIGLLKRRRGSFVLTETAKVTGFRHNIPPSSLNRQIGNATPRFKLTALTAVTALSIESVATREICRFARFTIQGTNKVPCLVDGAAVTHIHTHTHAYTHSRRDGPGLSQWL